jgi:hypothetical protein
LRGRTAERLVGDELRRRGAFVIPSYDYAGEDGDKAPRMAGWEVSWVLPDLDVCFRGRRVWVEVKAKASADWTRKTQRWEHGISRRLLCHYRQVRRESGCPVWICVYEENTRLVLLQDLAVLERPENCREYDGEKMGRGGMFFFARGAMIFWAMIDGNGTGQADK